MIISIRADEAMHREVNHHLGDLKESDPMENHDYYVVDDTTKDPFKADDKKSSQETKEAQIKGN